MRTTDPTDADPPPDALLAAFDQQVVWCAQPSPFTSRVLARSRLWLAQTPAAHAALSALAADPLAAAVALRWAAGLHLLALLRLAPWADLWPPNGLGLQADDQALDAAIALAWASQQPLLRDALSRAPQTNEVQRSAALLPGLLYAAGRHATPVRPALPVALLEIGASAGLNLWCDRYGYAPQRAPGQTAWTWGDADAPLTLQALWSGPAPWAPAAAAPALRILRRAACDAHPVDLRQPAEGLRGASFIWPDQADRLARLRSAQHAAAGWMAADGVHVQAASAADFVALELALRPPRALTVLMHSVVWQYIAPDEQRRISDSMQAAGRSATAESPLAWLRLEPPQTGLKVELRCRFWPGDEDVLLAHTHPHAASMDWLAGPAGPAE